MNDFTQRRSSVFELVRILAMFMIVFEHCLLATALHDGPPLSFVDNMGWFMEAFTICAVNLFFLLTGYFLRDGNFKVSRIAKIWLRAVFYSAGIYIIGVVTGIAQLDKSIIFSFLPVLYKQYWFIQTYIVLALIAPFVAKMLDRLEKIQHLILCIILLIFFSAHETVIPVSRTLDTTQGYGIIWGMTLLIMGNFIRKYGRTYIKKIRSIVWIMMYAICACSIFLSNYLIVKYNIAQGVTSRGNFYAYNSLSVCAEGIFLFCFFVSMNERNKSCYSKIINWFSSSAIAIYLISAHPLLISFLWTNIFKMGGALTKPMLYLMLAVVMTIIVMLMCILLDKLLMKITEFMHAGNLWRKLDNSVFNRIMNM